MDKAPLQQKQSSGDQMSSSESLADETFSHRLVREFRTHFRWWRVGAFLGVAIPISYWIGVGLFLLWVFLLALTGLALLFADWLATSRDRARAALFCLVFIWFGKPLMERFNREFVGYEYESMTPSERKTSPFPRDTQRLDLATKEQRQKKFNATFAYWMTAVSNLHVTRFQIPTGNEPTDQVFAKRFAELERLVNLAKFAPIADVDQDLMEMVKRHLTIEDQLLDWKNRAEDWMKREGFPSDKTPIGERMAETQKMLAALFTDPSLLDRIPEGEFKILAEQMLELEELRLEVYREIEIMQAVLQERYPGTKFPLPDIEG